ncbi:MAG: antibiotic biosynthesis monooxygenase [Rhizobiaceae bacterium]|nr:antibiotic biosynthesis monooxygenase [Rhizobiaceae bacterium]
MLMRITWGRARPGMVGDLERQFHLHPIPAADGMIGNWFAKDIKDSESIYTVTLWRDAEAVAAWENSPARAERARELSKYLIGEYSVSLCEVSDGAGVPLPGKSAGQGRIEGQP